MLNIYSNIFHWEKMTFSKSSFSKFIARSVFGKLQFMQISLSFETSWSSLEIGGLGAKVNFEWNYHVLKSKRQWFFWTKMYTLVKMKWNLKWKIPCTQETWTLCFSSYKNCKLKMKLCWAGARKRNELFCSMLFTHWEFFGLCYILWLSIGNLLFITYLLLIELTESI